MSGPIENLEAVVDGEVKFPPLTAEQLKQVHRTVGELAAASTIGVVDVPMPELTSADQHSHQAA